MTMRRFENEMATSRLWRTLFGDSARAFGVVSVVLLVSLAIAPAKNHFSEWRHYQNAYCG